MIFVFQRREGIEQHALLLASAPKLDLQEPQQYGSKNVAVATHGVESAKSKESLYSGKSDQVQDTTVQYSLVGVERKGNVSKRHSLEVLVSLNDNKKSRGTSTNFVIVQKPKLLYAAFTAETTQIPNEEQSSSHYSAKFPAPILQGNQSIDKNKFSSHHNIRNHCNISSVKSWMTGLITELQPRIKANCDQLRNNDRREVDRVKKAVREWKSSVTDEKWIQSLNNCSEVVRDFSANFYNSPEEQSFPLAYILIVYTNPQQVVRLIKALWRPQNLFCVHPDAKQSEEFIGVFRQLSKCLHNVFVPTKLEKVYYQHHSIMDSQINCYEDLMQYSPDKWKYVINLCGRELPLKTNREIVRSLKKLRGASAVDSRHSNVKGFLKRDRFTWIAKENYTTGKLYYTNKRLPQTPIPIYKSFNFIAVSRPFVNFFLHDEKAIQFRNYLKDVKIPEEEFYASVIHLPGVPGGNPPHRISIPIIDKYIWMNKNYQTRSNLESCEGRMVHFICIVSVGDLDQIFRWGVKRRIPTFFFNKYFMEDDHVVMDCMEEWLIQQNKKEYLQDCPSND